MTNNVIEIWKDVVDFEGYYQVSSLGRIRFHPERERYHNTVKDVLKPYSNRGYLAVTLCVSNKRYRRSLHQLVARAFLPNFHYGNIVNHIDGNKHNNCVSNLEKSSSSLNNTHAYQSGLKEIANKKSKYFGVSTIDRRIKRKDGTINIIRTYTAQLRVNGKKIYIKQSTNELKCAKAYDDYLDLIGDIVHKRNFS